MELSADEQADTIARSPTPRPKRNFSGLSLEEAMEYIGQTDFVPWQIDAAPRPPTVFLIETLARFDGFSLTNSEAAKLLLIDALLTETIPQFPRLRIWKGEPLNTNLLTGVADYLIAPKRAFLKSPVLCAVEAKKDDFDQGSAQCVAEMAACRAVNKADGHTADIHGIVSNGQGWEFYRLDRSGDVLRTDLYTIRFLPELLAALYHVFTGCDTNLPPGFSPRT